MINPAYSYLLFDLDNTILDFTYASHHAFTDIVRLLDLKDRDALYPIYKKINKKVWKELELGHISQDEVRHKRWSLFFDEIQCNANPSDTNDAYLQSLIQYIQFVPGAKDLLRYCQDHKVKMAIITNGLKEVQRPRIAKAQINHFFEKIIVSDEIGVSKPHTGFFDYVMNELGDVDKKDCLVIGDTLQSDILGGNQYGMDTCWYNPTGIDDSVDIVPSYTIDRLEELIPIILPLQT